MEALLRCAEPREEADHALERFFFSSRRRHTRSKRDWSSDVCSSDLRVRPSRLLRWIGWPGRPVRAAGSRQRQDSAPFAFPSDRAIGIAIDSDVRATRLFASAWRRILSL